MAGELTGRAVAILLAEGVEDREYHVTRMRLEEEGAEVLTVATALDSVSGKNGLAAEPDTLIEAVDASARLGLA